MVNFEVESQPQSARAAALEFEGPVWLTLREIAIGRFFEGTLSLIEQLLNHAHITSLGLCDCFLKQEVAKDKPWVGEIHLCSSRGISLCLRCQDGFVLHDPHGPFFSIALIDRLLRLHRNSLTLCLCLLDVFNDHVWIVAIEA